MSLRDGLLVDSDPSREPARLTSLTACHGALHEVMGLVPADAEDLRRARDVGFEEHVDGEALEEQRESRTRFRPRHAEWTMYPTGCDYATIEARAAVAQPRLGRCTETRVVEDQDVGLRQARASRPSARRTRTDATERELAKRCGMRTSRTCTRQGVARTRFPRPFQEEARQLRPRPSPATPPPPRAPPCGGTCSSTSTPSSTTVADAVGTIVRARKNVQAITGHRMFPLHLRTRGSANGRRRCTRRCPLPQQYPATPNTRPGASPAAARNRRLKCDWS